MWDAATAIWPVFAGGIGFIVWLVRLEGMASQTRREVDALRVKHEALDSKIVEQLGEVRESLARIEGRMGITD